LVDKPIICHDRYWSRTGLIMKTNWDTKKVLILGAARQGLALAHFLSSQGADVTINDSRPESEMQSVINTNSNLKVQWVFGSHSLDLLKEIDLLCVSGGVPLDIPLIKKAIEKEIPLSNDSQIFMDLVPCPVIGITGSAGKTTTTALLGAIAKTHFGDERKVWVGGNIGTPLIDQVGNINEKDLAILELSSFQLDLMKHVPNISAILNITPNHLDRHKTFNAYIAAKARILKYQNHTDTAILGSDDPTAWSLHEEVEGKLISFGFNQVSKDQPGCFLKNNDLILFDGENTQFIMKKEDIQLRGKHNVNNVLAACACAYTAGITIDSMREGTRNFKGIAHRLEFIRELNGVTWINDSIATAPERTSAAIRSFSEPLVLLLGGRDKDLPWNDLASLIKQRVDHVVVFGEASEKIISAISNIKQNAREVTLNRCGNLEEAVKQAHRIAEPGDIVLLAPGGTSYDEFKDFEERGESYRKWVKQLI